MAIALKHFRAPVELLLGSVAMIQAVVNAFRVMYECDMLRFVVLSPPLIREWHSVMDVYNTLGPTYFRRAYRMSLQLFYHLHLILLQHIVSAREKLSLYQKKGKRAGGNYKDPPVCNGPVSSTVRLACAIRYFAGGSPYKIGCVYGV
jgi:hypothetical protein